MTTRTRNAKAMRLLFLMAFQYTHILCRVPERRSQDRVPKLTGISGCCRTPGESSAIRTKPLGREQPATSLRVVHYPGLPCGRVLDPNVAKPPSRVATMINVRGRGTSFILRCGTKDYVLLLPQSRQRINSGRS